MKLRPWEESNNLRNSHQNFEVNYTHQSEIMHFRTPCSQHTCCMKSLASARVEGILVHATKSSLQCTQGSWLHTFFCLSSFTATKTDSLQGEWALKFQNALPPLRHDSAAILKFSGLPGCIICSPPIVVCPLMTVHSFPTRASFSGCVMH